MNMSEENICRLVDPRLIVAPQDKGSPPSWVPAFHGEEVVWVDREIFDKLKKLRDDKPCNICPTEIKKKCEISKLCRGVADEELEKFKNDITAQEKRVNEKINPILELYDQGKIKRKELVEKLSEAFYSLEEND
jgi:hypothetical protein